MERTIADILVGCCLRGNAEGDRRVDVDDLYSVMDSAPGHAFQDWNRGEGGEVFPVSRDVVFNVFLCRDDSAVVYVREPWESPTATVVAVTDYASDEANRLAGYRQLGFDLS